MDRQTEVKELQTGAKMFEQISERVQHNLLVDRASHLIEKTS